ncbi:MAG: class A beta-lactamase [Muribaculaceae bacterium]|nr:class A beta-lactamase [Muribaculaceae bacterium]
MNNWKRNICRGLMALATMAVWIVGLTGCRTGEVGQGLKRQGQLDELKRNIEKVANEYDGRIGVALITSEGDTVEINVGKYPLMSVFKVHQAVALLHEMESKGLSADSIVRIPRNELNAETWSPMMKDHPEDTIVLSVRDLLRYTLTQSDNNASNYLFRHFTDVASTDRFIATVIPRESFRISVTEEDMWREHKRSLENYSTPLGVAILLDKLYTDSIIGADNQDFICQTLRQCTTGTDRIVKPLLGKKGVTAGHKTGSGYRENGILMAHNDAAFITLPDGKHYTLVVLVSDFRGDEEKAAEAIANISAIVWNFMQK